MKINNPRKHRGFQIYTRLCGKCGKHFKTDKKARGKRLRCNECFINFAPHESNSWKWYSKVMDAVKEGKDKDGT